MEEIRDVTFGLWGSELPEHSAVQRLARAGFPIWVPSHLDITDPHSPLLDMFAIIEGESGSYLKAWHANLLRDEFDNIVYDELGRMTVKSIDLGFIQRNIILNPYAHLLPTKPVMEEFVLGKFAEYPWLARADLSSAHAYDLWLDRGFKPWYAYKPGTPGFKVKKRRASMAVGNWLIRSFVGKVDLAGYPAETYPRLVFQ